MICLTSFDVGIKVVKKKKKKKKKKSLPICSASALAACRTAADSPSEAQRDSELSFRKERNRKNAFQSWPSGRTTTNGGGGRERMKRKKKRPLAPPPLKSLKRARQVTSAFHAATRSLDEALARGDAEAAAIARRAVEAAGGREAYQQASAAATGRHKTASRFVWSHLTRLGFREKGRNDGRGRPRLLEIGAINTQLLSTPWLEVRSVDLRAPPGAAGPPSGEGENKKERRRIEAIDFFDVARLPQRGEFDAVVCSMVLNCLTTPEQRGEMLRGIRRHLRFEEEGGEGEGARVEEEEEEEEEERGGGGGASEEASAAGARHKGSKRGVAFIMLPRRCVEASRACDWAGFERCMARVGLGEVLARRASAKVAFWLVRATAAAATTAATTAAAIPGSSPSSTAAAASEGEVYSSLIAAAHAAGEFAVNMKEAGGTEGGGGEKKKKMGTKRTKEERKGS